MNFQSYVPGVCVSVLGGMVFALGFNVSLKRQKYKIAGFLKPDDSSPAWIANRAHANAVEYVPTAIGLIIWISAHPHPVWVDGVMALFTCSRLLFTYGLLGYRTMEVPNRPRFLGA